jgi:hydrogenase expression/formation protein HypC
MCLAIPMKVIEIKEDRAIVTVPGVTQEVSIQTLPKKPQIGQYVIVHAGFAIEIIDEENAKETLQLFDELESSFAEHES